jgi:hypothetical protein
VKKKNHTSVRLDDETLAIVAKYQEQFGDDVSASQTIARLVRAADGEKFIVVKSSSLAPHEELSFFAAQLAKTTQLWREIRSRLNAPRPMDAADTIALKNWQEERKKIHQFYIECDSLCRKAHALSALLTTTSADEWLNLEDTAMMIARWAQECEAAAEKESNPAKKKSHLNFRDLYRNAVEFLRRVGIEPTPPEQDPTKK